MGNIALIVLANQRDRYPHRAERGIPLAGSGKYFTQCFINLRITSNKPAADGTQNIADSDNGVPRGVGMNDTASRIDEAHTDTKTIERIGERRSLRGLQIEHSSDQNRSAAMGNDQSHPMPCFIINHAVSITAKDSEHRYAACRVGAKRIATTK